MKMENSHYQMLKDAAKNVQKRHPDTTPQSYIDNKIGKDHAKRFRWDLFWSAAKNIPIEVKCLILDYLNDSHIDTAMKGIVKELYS